MGKVAVWPKHRLLFLTVCLLPFSLVPHEVLRSGPSLAPVMFTLAAILAIKYRPFGGVLGPVDLAVSALAAWMVARLVIIAPLAGEPGNWYFTGREVGSLAAGAILFRIARRPDLLRVILLGLGVGLSAMMAIEVYQVTAGIGHLTGLGYVSDEGFYYYTIGGSYRPFGTFDGPTVFGAYLAMVGVVVLLATRRWKWLVFVALASCLLMTRTRSAWIAFALALASVFMLGSSRRRARALVGAFPAAWAATMVALLRPDLANSVLDRVQSIGQAGDVSTVTRIALWAGTVDTVSRDHWFFGYGAQSFTETTLPIIGPTALLGHPHSNYMQELFRYGLPGLSLFVVLLAAFLVELRRSRRDGGPWMLGLAAVVAFAEDSVFNNSLSGFNFLVTLFLLVGLGCARPGQGDDLSSGRREVHDEPESYSKPRLGRSMEQSDSQPIGNLISAVSRPIHRVSRFLL